MIVLAIDSTATAASAAVVSDSKIIAEYTQDTGHTHSETLLPMVEAVMNCAGIVVSDIDLFAVSAGPGSFTGVRIGISLIKGLAFGRSKPVAGLSSMDCLAKNLQGFDGVVCPVMDARRNQLYTAIYLNGKKMTEDMLIPCEELADMLSAYNCPIYFTGDGYYLAHSKIELPGIVETPPRLRLQNAASVAFTALDCYAQNKYIYTADEIQPIYLRASQAERERLERMKEQ